MSEIKWFNTIVPDMSSVSNIDLSKFYDGFIAKNICVINSPDEDLVKLPDRRAYKSLSRAGVLLSASVLPAKEIISNYIENDSFNVGLYAAVHHGPECYGALDAIPEIDNEFSEKYKKAVSPKDYLKVLANLAACQLSIFLNNTGPTYTFVHSHMACVQALIQAELDLLTGTVDTAIVCSASSYFNDPVLLAKTRNEIQDDIILCEGASAMILRNSENKVDWMKHYNEIKNNYLLQYNFGIADFLTKFLIKEKDK